MPSRTFHNLINSIILEGFSGNQIHEYMDRFSRSLRQKHRQKGHDIQALLELILLFHKDYSIDDIISTYILHTEMDKFFDGVQSSVRGTYKKYGKKKKKSDQQQILDLLSKL